MAEEHATALGRIYIPDERDYNLEDFEDQARKVATSTDPLQAALDSMMKSRSAAPSVKAWAKIATARIIAVSPPGPPPQPPPPTPSDQDKTWDNPRAVLNQGQEGTCVGHGWAQWGNTSPVNDDYSHDDARKIYLDATTHDGHTDNTYQQGASVRGGAQAMQDRGRLSNYAFTQSVDTAKNWVQNKGPIVMGTNWYTDMFKPDASGLIKITGSYAGGHCWLWSGNIPEEGVAFCENSWGDAWGLKGFFLVKFTDIATLLSQQGEACAAVELA